MKYLIGIFISLFFISIIFSVENISYLKGDECTLLDPDTMMKMKGGTCTFGLGDWISDYACSWELIDCGGSCDDEWRPACMAFPSFYCAFYWSDGCDFLEILNAGIGKLVCGGCPNIDLYYLCESSQGGCRD